MRLITGPVYAVASVYNHAVNVVDVVYALECQAALLADSELRRELPNWQNSIGDVVRWLILPASKAPPNAIVSVWRCSQKIVGTIN